jgi:NADPH:quinone reductase-like Zn-dependent oxidoreductase
MKAIVQQGYGGPEVLQMEERPRPTVDAGHVVIEVKAAAIDRGTWHLMAGKPLIMRPFTGLTRPRQPVQGRDVAGVIVEVGPGVEGFGVGDEVLGTADGSLAEFAKVPVTRLAKKPAGISFEQAAALPVSGLTALQAIRDHARVARGERVLVLGASGGVGSYVVQLAKAEGAQVTAVCSGAKAAFVRDLGADVMVAYDDGPLSFDTPFDVIFDIGGNPSVKTLRGWLRPGGRAVLVGGEGGDALTGGMWRPLWGSLTNVGKATRMIFFVSAERGEDMSALAAHVEKGHITPAIDRVLPFAEAQQAMTLLEQGQVKGKLVLTP